MAGIEQLEIHSKSYLVRWVQVAAGDTISWSLQSHKRSINFGIFKHPGATSTLADSSQSLLPSTNTSFTSDGENGRRSRSGSAAQPLAQAQSTVAKSEAASVTEKLQSLGMKAVSWYGRCEADLVIKGSYEVAEGEAGMYGMVFDNTHSKQLSKNVTFVVMTFPTTAPPKSAQQSSLREVIGRERAGSTGRSSPNVAAFSDSERLTQPASMPELKRNPSRGAEWGINGEPTFYTGVLSKKRRKKNQGWARRFFSLDFTSSTLSYYKNRNSSALRGAIPLHLAAVGADEKSSHISIDSGAEIWILKANNQQDFNGWRNALERASQRPQTPAGGREQQPGSFSQVSDEANNRDWNRAEALVGNVAGITDSVRRLAKDTDPKYLPSGTVREPLSASPTLVETEGDDYFGTENLSTSAGRSRLPWRRKSSAQGRSPSGVFRQGNATQTSGFSSLAPPRPGHSLSVQKQRSFSNMKSHESTEEVHDRCMAVLRDLDAVVAQFSSLIAESRRRRMPERPALVGRASIDSTYSQEFFDAEDGLQHQRSQILRIRTDSETGRPDPASPQEPQEIERDDDSGSESDLDEAEDSFTPVTRPNEPSLFPPKPKSLLPLPHASVARRNTVPSSIGQPPSLIAFLRKNVGKDLSTISMPVTANEPLSLLQRQAEAMEYSQLLDAAVSASADTGERLLFITAFAISALSSSRCKERAIRKPFNPMLGETFELVREDRGFRYLAEKVSHRPVRVACQAEHNDWTYTHAPSPSQKFWGKSAEITTDGKARVRLHATGDCYSWTPATCFLRNIIAGEKYVEPVASMTVLEETSGRKAVVTFKSGGMFSGRSEDVSVQAVEPDGHALPLGLQGKWTTSLTLTSQSHGHAPGTGQEIWQVGELVKDAPKRYGMTAFAATLNEITDMEGATDEKVLPPTDSRQRPDQRCYEDGQVDKAERMKAHLEEAQRRRRKEMETSGEVWESRWFHKVGSDGDDDVWVMKGEKEGKDYWSVREAVKSLKHGHWDGVNPVFELD